MPLSNTHSYVHTGEEEDDVKKTREKKIKRRIAAYKHPAWHCTKIK